MIHGLVNCQNLPSSVLEINGFWSDTSYNIGGHGKCVGLNDLFCIGGHIFSLDDIEHGILRCNKPHPGSGRVMFQGDDDPRLKFVMDSLDPRIHFALVCGAQVSDNSISYCQCTLY